MKLIIRESVRTQCNTFYLYFSRGTARSIADKILVETASRGQTIRAGRKKMSARTSKSGSASFCNSEGNFLSTIPRHPSKS